MLVLSNIPTQFPKYLDLSVFWQVKCLHFDNSQTTLYCKVSWLHCNIIFSLLIENMFTLYCWHFTDFSSNAINLLLCYSNWRKEPMFSYVSLVRSIIEYIHRNMVLFPSFDHKNYLYFHQYKCASCIEPHHFYGISVEPCNANNVAAIK